MSRAVPHDIREHIRIKIWAKADALDWTKITDLERTAWYENWSKDKEIGGVLGHFMDPRKVRVYIKDSLLKPYQRVRLHEGLEKVLNALGINEKEVCFRKTFSKPHGRLLSDGRVICWGSSRDWKLVLFSVFERGYQTGAAIPYAAALIETGNTRDDSARQMILEASRRLGLNRLTWVES